MSWLGLEFEIYDETNPRPEDRVVIPEPEPEPEPEIEIFIENLGCEPIMELMPSEVRIKTLHKTFKLLCLQILDFN